MKHTLRAPMILVGAAVLTLGGLVWSEALACPFRHGPDEPLCLSVADGRNTIFTLRVVRHDMFDPPRQELRIVQALTNNTEPVLGLAYGSGLNTLVNLQGTVAGFFTGMQFKYSPNGGTGTGRVLGELQAHPSVTVTEVSCQ